MIEPEEDNCVYNGHFEIDVFIEKPAAEVWARFVDAASWVTTHVIETVRGTSGATGSITRVSWELAKSEGLPPAHYHYCKVIKVVPERQYVLKSYSEKGGSYGMNITAFDDTRFIPEENRTRIVFNFFAEIRSPAVAANPAAMNLDSSRDGMLRNLMNLKRLVEAT